MKRIAGNSGTGGYVDTQWLQVRAKVKVWAGYDTRKHLRAWNEEENFSQLRLNWESKVKGEYFNWENKNELVNTQVC